MPDIVRNAPKFLHHQLLRDRQPCALLDEMFAHFSKYFQVRALPRFRHLFGGQLWCATVTELLPYGSCLSLHTLCISSYDPRSGFQMTLMEMLRMLF
jgi:hypothetical protein